MERVETETVEYERVSLYIPTSITERIEKERGDIPRSKFIQRIIEKHYKLKPQ